jgi:hypothetical protein
MARIPAGARRQELVDAAIRVNLPLQVISTINDRNLLAA